MSDDEKPVVPAWVNTGAQAPRCLNPRCDGRAMLFERDRPVGDGARLHQRWFRCVACGDTAAQTHALAQPGEVVG